MIGNDNFYEDVLELYDLYPSGRIPDKLKNPRGYSEARGLRDRRLHEYDYEEDENLNDYDPEETRLF